MGILEAAHIRPEFRQSEPLRHLPLEHAARAPIIAGARPLAGDHQHELVAVGLRAAQEAKQGEMRLALGLAVQVEPAIDLDGTAGEALLGTAIERLLELQPALDRGRRASSREARAPRWDRARLG